MTTIQIPNGILHLAESKALCPVCHAPQPIEVLEPKWMKIKGHSMRHKCKCVVCLALRYWTAGINFPIFSCVNIVSIVFLSPRYVLYIIFQIPVSSVDSIRQSFAHGFSCFTHSRASSLLLNHEFSSELKHGFICFCLDNAIYI